MDQGRNFDSDPAGDRNFCRQLCMWEENGESRKDTETKSQSHSKQRSQQETEMD